MESWTRRQLLLGSSVLAAGGVAAGGLAPSAAVEPQPTESSKLKVLVVPAVLLMPAARSIALPDME